MSIYLSIYPYHHLSNYLSICVLFNHLSISVDRYLFDALVTEGILAELERREARVPPLLSRCDDACECVCERERERECVCVWKRESVCERLEARVPPLLSSHDDACECVCERERER